METIECKHKETIRSLEQGIEVGECSICHQKVQYNRKREKEKPVVVKLGRIDGRIILPNPGYALLLPPEDQADLAAVLKKEITPLDAEWSGLNRLEKAAYFRLHQEEIQHDIEELGELAARKK